VIEVLSPVVPPVLLPRRSLLLGLGALAASCGARVTDRTTLRLGFFPNVTHAPAFTGLHSGRFAEALGGVRLAHFKFNAGPEAIGALLAGELDATFVGPIPAAAGFVRSRGKALRVVAGAASGGASFIVRRGASIRGPSDLRGRRLAAPQIGGTQDVALRHYLAGHGLRTSDAGGDVLLTSISNPNILGLFRQGDLDGAWVPEPWASRLVREGGGERLLDERDLWPGRAFATTLLVARADYLRDAPDAVDRLVDAHAREVRWIRAHDAEARALFGAAFEAKTGRKLAEPLLAAAWPRIDFTVDALRASVETSVRRAYALGFFPSEGVAGLFDDARVARAREICAQIA
jgi:NitT/TauT family transport system substrate-binding protein